MELVKAGRGITIHIYGQSRKTLCGRQITEFIYYTAEASCKRCLSIHKTNTQLADHATALVAEVNAEIGQSKPEVPAVEPSNSVMIYSQPIGMIQWESVSSRWCNGYYDTQRRAAELARETADTAFAVVDTVTGEVITEYFGSRAIDHPGEFLPVTSAGESQDAVKDPADDSGPVRIHVRFSGSAKWEPMKAHWYMQRDVADRAARTLASDIPGAEFAMVDLARDEILFRYQAKGYGSVTLTVPDALMDFLEDSDSPTIRAALNTGLPVRGGLAVRVPLMVHEEILDRCWVLRDSAADVTARERRAYTTYMKRIDEALRERHAAVDWDRDEVMAAYRVAHQQATSLARIVGTDGPARFRARQGKRKPSSHRRGW